MATSDFNEQLKAAMLRHAEMGFTPKTYEASMATKRAYEQRPETKAKKAEWRKSEAGKESDRRRHKKWAKAHPEKVAEKSARYYAKHKEELAEKRKKRLEDPEYREHINALNRKYNAKMRNDPDRTEHNRKVRKEWKLKNADRVKELRKKAYDKLRNDPVRWAKHLEKVRERNRKKRLSKEAV